MKKLIFLLSFVSSLCYAQFYYGSSEAVNLENRIKFKNNVRIGTQNTTPSALDYATGSMVLKTDGTLWLKQYGDSNQWGRVASASDLNLYVLKSGDTMTGDLTVQANIHAENYVHTGAIRATSSAGILIQNQANNNVIDIGPANTQNVSIYGGLNIDGQTRIKTNEIGHILSVAGVLSGQQYATNSVLIGNGYGAFNSVAPGTQGNLLISNGTAFESATGSNYFISSLNGLTNNSQTFATGSTGGDFNISSSAGVHTLNIPDASGSSRGLLTQSNFQAFNNKVDGQTSSVDGEIALFSGVGGKTIKRATGSGVAKVSSGVFATGSVNLANDEVTGVLNIANGGTNNNSFTDGFPVIATGSKLQNITTSSTGSVLYYDGNSTVFKQYLKGINDYDWTSYTPALSTWGTTTNVSFYHKRVGSDLLIMWTFTSGTPAASEARVELPSGLTSSSIIPTLQYIGNWANSDSSTVYSHTALIEASKTYFVMGYRASGVNDFTKKNANQLVVNGSTISGFVRIPIEEWEGTL